MDALRQSVDAERPGGTPSNPMGGGRDDAQRRRRIRHPRHQRPGLGRRGFVSYGCIRNAPDGVKTNTNRSRTRSRRFWGRIWIRRLPQKLKPKLKNVEARRLLTTSAHEVTNFSAHRALARHPARSAGSMALGRNVYPHNHDDENQDRIKHNPHNVGSPTPPLLYSLLAHCGCHWTRHICCHSRSQTRMLIMLLPNEFG
jgi:hypothetical protein